MAEQGGAVEAFREMSRGMVEGGHAAGMALADELVTTAEAVASVSIPGLDRASEGRYVVGFWYSLRTDLVDTAGGVRAISPAAAEGYAEQALIEFNVLAVKYMTRYQISGDSAAFFAALALLRLLAVLTPPDHMDRGTRLANLGATLSALHRFSGDVAHLEEAVVVGREAAEVIADDHPDVVACLATLGGSLVTLFERTNDVALLEESVAVGRRAVAAAPEGHDRRPVVLANLATALSTIYEQTGDLTVLRDGIEVARQAVATGRVDDPEIGAPLTVLGGMLLALFDRTGNTAALAEAVEVRHQAVEITPDGHPKRPGRLVNLASALLTSYHRAGEPSRLAGAVKAAREAVVTPGATVAERGAALAQLANGLHSTFERTGALPVLRETVDVAQQAVDACASGHPQRVAAMTALATALRELSARTGDPAALDDAIRVAREVMAATPEGHQHRVGRLSNLGLGLLMSFERSGDPAVLEETVRLRREVAAGTLDSDVHRPGFLANLAGVLLRWFERSGDSSALAEAVSAGRQALAALPEEDPARGDVLANLSASLLRLFDRTGEVTALREAVELGKQALTATPPGHRHLLVLSTLSSAIHALGVASEDVPTLRTAVDVGRRLVEATPADDPRRAMYLSNLGSALCDLFDRSDEPALLTEAMAAGEQAVAACPEHHPDSLKYLANLGLTLRTSHEKTGDPVALRDGRRYLTAATEVTSGAVDLRTAAASWAAELDLVAGDADHALAMAEQAAELLNLVAPRRLRRRDRRHRVIQTGGLPATAATAGIVAGQPERAVELLEQTRARLITDSIDTRGDLTELRRLAPNLAAEFTDLRDRIDDLDHAPNSAADADRTAAPRLLEQWEDLLTRIRAHPGTTEFLRPSIDDLRRAAGDGPVVIVVIHPHSSHALVVRDEPARPVEVIRLPDLTMHDAIHHISELDEARRAAADANLPARERVAAQKKVHGVFGWLWDAAAAPILDRIGCTGTPPDGQPWPRVWWCPVGIATLLPFHAAGHHIHRDARTVLDRVISSYTPSIRTLLHARSRPTSSATSTRTLVVAVPDAPGTPALGGVRDEVEHLCRLIPTATVVPTPGDTSTVRTVEAALADHAIAHFACHGVADRTDPTGSRLVLHDHRTDPLTVERIARLRLDHARLAYLSACSTTDTAVAHSDEATHLTAAFHIAGYTNVVGTTWPIPDDPSFTTTFYDHLTRGGTTPPDPSRTAQALHHTTRQYRTAQPNRATYWAAHTHTGP